MTFTSIVEVDQVFTETDDVAEQIANFAFTSPDFDQDEQFELFEFISENMLTCQMIDAKDLAEDGSDFLAFFYRHHLDTDGWPDLLVDQGLQVSLLMSSPIVGWFSGRGTS